MSERSEFGLRHREGANVPLSAEKRRGATRLHRGGSRPAKGLFGSFLVPPKGTRTRQRAKALQLHWFRSFTATCTSKNRASAKSKNRASALVARLTFVLSRVSTAARTRWRTAKPARRASARGASQTAIAGRDPARLRRAGPLRSLPDAARRPNSLRSDMGASTAAPACRARLALRLGTSMATATATATAGATAGATARATSVTRSEATARATAKGIAKAIAKAREGVRPETRVARAASGLLDVCASAWQARA